MSAVVRFAMLLTLSAMPVLAVAQAQQDAQPSAQRTKMIATESGLAAPADTGAAVSAQDPATSPSGANAPQTTDATTTAVEPASAEEPAPTTVADTTTTSGTGSSKIGPPQDGKGQIVFFRPSKFAGAAVGFKVREGSTELGKLRSGKYFVASVDPGTHEYTVHSESEDVLTMEVEAGETYYVQGTLTMGVMVGRPNLSPSDEATFNGMADKLKLAK
jgi:hypothetical protein